MENMTDFINFLNELYTDCSTTYTCYCLKTKHDHIVSLKVELGSDELKKYMTACLKYLTEKVYAKMELGDFPQASPKDFIERLASDSENISERYQEIFYSLLNPETNDTKLSSYDSYMIVASKYNRKTIFINKQKMFKAYKERSFIYAPIDSTKALFDGDGKYIKLTSDLVSLKIHFDCIMDASHCYFITLKGRSIFNILQTDETKTLETFDDLVTDKIILPAYFKEFDNYLKQPGKSKCLANIDQSIIDTIKNATANDIETLKNRYKLEFELDQEGNVVPVLSTREQIDAFIFTITHLRAQDFNGNIVFTNSPFTEGH